MNYIHLSPHFPPNYHLFSVRLRKAGATVLGLADEKYEHLHPELRAACVEYYRVSDLHNYDELLRACGYFTHRYGKIDRIESHNEYWLEQEARLRTDFNVEGPKIHEMEVFRSKARMKEFFRKAQVEAIQGSIARTPEESKEIAARLGFPLIAKPDRGMGAAKTYKIHNAGELEAFWREKPPVDYLFEEYIDGTIQTFDGLADQDSHPVFFTSLRYSKGVMEAVNHDSDIWFYSLRQVPPDLEAAGRRLLSAFQVRERFFHFEFFRLSDGRLLGLEVNLRPPGGPIVDMFNFANDFDIYQEYANLLVKGRMEASYHRPYFCSYVGRKNHLRYALRHEEVMARYGSMIIHHAPVPSVFARAMGNYMYILRSPSEEEILAAVTAIETKA